MCTCMYSTCRVCTLGFLIISCSASVAEAFLVVEEARLVVGGPVLYYYDDYKHYTCMCACTCTTEEGQRSVLSTTFD